jgi:hypothetical protein
LASTSAGSPFESFETLFSYRLPVPLAETGFSRLRPPPTSPCETLLLAGLRRCAANKRLFAGLFPPTLNLAKRVLGRHVFNSRHFSPLVSARFKGFPRDYFAPILRPVREISAPREYLRLCAHAMVERWAKRPLLRGFHARRVEFFTVASGI